MKNAVSVNSEYKVSAFLYYLTSSDNEKIYLFFK